MATARDLSEVEKISSLSPQLINLSDHAQAEVRALTDANNAKIHSSRTGEKEVIPKVGPGFNGSAASGGQITLTIDNARAPCWNSRHRRLSSRYPCAELPDSKGEDIENKMNVNFFKKCMQKNGEGEREKVQDSRKRKMFVADTRDASPHQIGLQVVNKNGDVVDLKTLLKADALCEQELRRRTAGMVRKEELLVFLSSLEGKWGSTRRKRRIVDASLLEDAFPVGWKIIIALRKKNGWFSPYCRRFISPTGEQFLSCVEAASFLSNDERKEGDVREVKEKSSGKKPVTEEISSNAAVHDTYECPECKASYNSKDAYQRHVLLFHYKTTRKYQGSPVGKGVIMRDGKFVCQFCNKVFLEKRSYTCHVGVHVRNFNRGSEDLFEEEAIDIAGMSAMQAMAVIARRVIEAKSLPAIGSSSVRMGKGSVSEVPNPAAGTEPVQLKNGEL